MQGPLFNKTNMYPEKTPQSSTLRWLCCGQFELKETTACSTTSPIILPGYGRMFGLSRAAGHVDQNSLKIITHLQLYI